MPDPIHQFDLHRIFDLKLGSWDVSFTNSALFMLLAVLVTTAFFMLATQARALVPGRLQSVAEIAHDFVAGMCRESMGKEGMKFFPFVFALFIFIFVCNMMGMIPGAFTVTLIEIFSFLTRPVSHSVRLFANMLAGHITLKVFGGFVVMLLGAGSFAALAPLPFLMAIAITALEVLVAFLQAYVFAILTCMYLNDALHPGGH